MPSADTESEITLENFTNEYRKTIQWDGEDRDLYLQGVKSQWNWSEGDEKGINYIVRLVFWQGFYALILEEENYGNCSWSDPFLESKEDNSLGIYFAERIDNLDFDSICSADDEDEIDEMNKKFNLIKDKEDFYARFEV